MFLLRFWPRWAGPLLLVLLVAACTRKTVSFNSRPGDLAVASLPTGDSLTTTARRGKPTLNTAAKKAVLTKAEERAAKEQDKAAQRKPRKKKRIFLGERIKRGYVRSGPKGKNQIVEIFFYLKTFQQPNAMAPASFYYSPKKHKLFASAGELDPATDKVLHGPYKKMQNNKVLETGYFALGTRHLRWEKFDTKGTLLTKTHYEMGFPRDANISYYDAGNTMLKEVVPYVNGKLEGDYAKFNNEGKREWTGKFENGRRVGEWTNYWGYKNYRHYVYQYGASGYEPEVTEPELVREYSHGGSVIFDKEKNIDKRGEPDPDAQATDPRRPGSHGVPTPRPPLRKPAERRPGYHPKPAVSPPAVSPTPTSAPASLAPGQPQ